MENTADATGSGLPRESKSAADCSAVEHPFKKKCLQIVQLHAARLGVGREEGAVCDRLPHRQDGGRWRGGTGAHRCASGHGALQGAVGGIPPQDSDVGGGRRDPLRGGRFCGG
eukprot:scaffold3487_cov102-Isochrysis_galbana.AAC.1